MTTQPGFDAPILVNVERPDFSDAHLIGVNKLETASTVANVFRAQGYMVKVRVWSERGYSETHL